MSLSQAILATLAYHDIFDYPLTQEEILRYLINKRASPPQVKKELTKLIKSSKIGKKHLHYFLKNRPNLIAARRERAKYSQAKLKRAKLYSKLLTLIPTIKLIAISGALAMNNSQKGDDIDLVIITAKNTLWTTRFLANLILLPFKRKPFIQGSSLVDKQLKDKACLNLFLDESDLKIHPQNLYTAHEICQMKPLWDEGETYSRFIDSNKWIYKFLPNWEPSFSVIEAQAGIYKKREAANLFLVSGNWKRAESLLRSFQLWYMRKKISTERIGKHQLFFHPLNTQAQILEQYQKRLKRLSIL